MPPKQATRPRHAAPKEPVNRTVLVPAVLLAAAGGAFVGLAMVPAAADDQPVQRIVAASAFAPVDGPPPGAALSGSVDVLDPSATAAERAAAQAPGLAPEQAAADQLGADQVGPDQVGPDPAGADRAPDQALADQGAAAQSPAAQAAAAQALADKAAADQVAAGQAAAGQAAAGQAAAGPARASRDRSTPAAPRPARSGYVRPGEGRLTSGYGRRWGRLHAGIDLAAGTGNPVRAVTSGRVISAGQESGYGNVVRLRHADGTETVYAHLSRILVSGGAVATGQQIGKEGNTGRSTGPHLHFEVRVNGSPVNPVAWLRGKGVRV